jgi:hypothetical protein
MLRGILPSPSGPSAPGSQEALTAAPTSSPQISAVNALIQLVRLLGRQAANEQFAPTLKEADGVAR